MMKIDKIRRLENLDNIVSAIKDASKLYKNELVGKKFMYVFDNRYIEVIYKNIHFKHLTGVESKLSAKRFYENCLNDKLYPEHIYFTGKHPYSLCVKKIKHIKEVATLACTESFMLEEILTKTRTYKFGTTDLNFTLCLNKEIDKDGKEIGDCYVAQSLRDEDCFAKCANPFIITHIFRKENNTEKYTDLVFMDKEANLSVLPDNINDMLDDKLLQSNQYYYEM